MIAQGDTVAVRTTMTGMDTGGFAGHPPTGRPFRSWSVDILGFRDGRIVGNWVGTDWLGFLVQLGRTAWDPWVRAPAGGPLDRSAPMPWTSSRRIDR